MSHSFNIYFLNTYFVPDILPGTQDTALSHEENDVSCPSYKLYLHILLTDSVKYKLILQLIQYQMLSIKYQTLSDTHCL